MLKLTSRQFLWIMIMGIFVLFPRLQGVQAEDEVPLTCTTDGGWTISLENVSAGDDYFVWTYRVLNLDGNTKGLNHINFNIRAEQGISVWESDDLNSATVQLYPIGAGDPTTYFGKGILQYFVAKFTPQQTSGLWSFASNSGNMETATGGLKINKSLEICKIAVPGDARFAAMAVSGEQLITTEDNKNFKILEDPYTQCILKVEQWNPTTNEWETLTKHSIGDLSILDNNGLDAPLEFLGVPGQGCPRAIVKREGEHTWYWFSGEWVWW